MASQANPLHFILFPVMAQGHMIPMIDIAKLLAQRGVMVTIVITPQNEAYYGTVLSDAISYGLPIHLSQIQFPAKEAGLPEGCENIDMLPATDLTFNWYSALNLLKQPAEELFETLMPRPNCIISDICFPWTVQIAHKYNIPRISFQGFSCFTLWCLHYHIRNTKLQKSSESGCIVLPGKHYEIEIKKSQIPGPLTSNLVQFSEEMFKAELISDGVLINTFQELEEEYVEDYKKVRQDKVWCIGPVSLCNKEILDKSFRGYKASIDENECMSWLNLQKPGSVVYACLGSLCNLIPSQLVELGLGLEASNKPFIWVLRGSNKTEEFEKWIMENGFEERIKKRGLLIRGWAPQVLILSHPSIGGFLTHCGWNSTLESISAGVPIITWPMFGDQFLNEKLVVQILKIGVRTGVEDPVRWGEEEKMGVLAKEEDIRRAIDKVMAEGEECKERRQKVRELGELAKKAMKDGGSSYLNMTKLILHITQQGRSTFE